LIFENTGSVAEDNRQRRRASQKYISARRLKIYKKKGAIDEIRTAASSRQVKVLEIEVERHKVLKIICHFFFWSTIPIPPPPLAGL
jgi:hypothetical protein